MLPIICLSLGDVMIEMAHFEVDFFCALKGL